MDLMLTLHGVPDMQLGSNQGHLKKGKGKGFRDFGGGPVMKKNPLFNAREQVRSLIGELRSHRP